MREWSLVVMVAAVGCDAGQKAQVVQRRGSGSAATTAVPAPVRPVALTPIEWRDPCALSIFLSDRYNIVQVDDHCHSAMITGSVVREDPKMSWLEDQLKWVKTWHGGVCTRVEIATDTVSSADQDRLRAIAVRVGFVDVHLTELRKLALSFPDTEEPRSCEPRRSVQ